MALPRKHRSVPATPSSGLQEPGSQPRPLPDGPGGRLLSVRRRQPWDSSDPLRRLHGWGDGFGDPGGAGGGCVSWDHGASASGDPAAHGRMWPVPPSPPVRPAGSRDSTAWTRPPWTPGPRLGQGQRGSRASRAVAHPRSAGEGEEGQRQGSRAAVRPLPGTATRAASSCIPSQPTAHGGCLVSRP